MNPQEPEPLRIRQIRIGGLFGLYNHCINLNLKERVTILHGPNGVGKTVTLRMVDALLERTSDIFFRVPFSLFKIEFTDGSSVRLSRHSLERFNESFYYGFTVSNGIPQEKPDAVCVTGGSPGASAQPPKSIPAKLFGVTARKAIKNNENRAFNHETFWQNKINAYFIGIHRLLYVPFKQRDGSIELNQIDIFSTTKEYADDLIDKIKTTLALYGQKSQTLDQSFPQRLLTASLADDVGLKDRMTRLDIQRHELKEIGLLDEATTPIFDPKSLDELIAKEKKFMTLYVQDTEQKLSELADLARRIKLLLNSINTKFQNKCLRIDRGKGFVVTNDAGKNLDLDLLSSGEQHEIVLLYDLLFRIKPNTLVLIDEPELSLHVSWQDHFLPDLLKIVEIAQFDVLIATHSPYIVGDYIDLMVALETGTKSV
ncbi:MAG: AAA family ATPase [Candidatus Methylumidiphilus sp.]